MKDHGFATVAVCRPVVKIGNPTFNAEQTLRMIRQNSHADVILFPELGITGYSCGDLFLQEKLRSTALHECLVLAGHVGTNLVFVGAPIAFDGQLYNCTVVLNNGEIIGIVPKQNIPNYKEFYEGRWWRQARRSSPPPGTVISLAYQDIPFGTDLLFHTSNRSLIVGAEICEDLWMTTPPSSRLFLAGADLVVNLSASNALAGKAQYRRELVVGQSGKGVGAYAYASCGPIDESSTDLVFSGHCMIAENGVLLAESDHVGGDSDPEPDALGETTILADIDISHIRNDRLRLTSFGEQAQEETLPMRRIKCHVIPAPATNFHRHIEAHPFVPKGERLKERCDEIFGIQVEGLARRLRGAGLPDVYIGVSGGLDSTLALLVATKAFRRLNLPLTKIHGITMPGFGTTDHTKSNALRLMAVAGITSKTVDIRAICYETWKAMGHRPFGIDIENLSLTDFELALRTVPKEKRHDLVFENVQARERTKILMSHGFTLGTGDLSELALGWCTYNGDHMSMYNVNCSIPKTLVRFLVRHVAEHAAIRSLNDGTNRLREILLSIADTVISPELLPRNDQGEIEQSTEATVGPYELNDFFLYHMVRNGFAPEKINFLASKAHFDHAYDQPTIKHWLRNFYRRFFSQQFKRSCVPDGPKVGSVSLSPRGDWRMPSDADMTLWMEALEAP